MENIIQMVKLRNLFIKRMTQDSPHHDKRRKDYNQAIFGYKNDGSTYAVWSETDMDMVLRCFDDAVGDLLSNSSEKPNNSTTEDCSDVGKE